MENQEIQEVERKKRFLRRYRKNLACINRLKKKLDLLEHKIKSARSSNLSGMPRGGTPLTMEDMIADKSDLEDRIKRLKKKGVTIKKQILEEIDSLDDSRYCEILEAFFIDCLSLEDIADKEGYTVRHVYKIYSEAVRALSVKGQ